MRGCVACNELWPWPIFSRSFIYDLAMKLKCGTSCRVRSTAWWVLERLFLNMAQMIYSMTGRVKCNDLWLWPIYTRSFSRDFASKLLKYGTSCQVRCTAHTVLDGLLLYLAQMNYSMRGWVACNHFWPWPLSSRSFSHDFIIKLLTYGASSHIHSNCTACIVLDEFFPFGH